MRRSFAVRAFVLAGILAPPALVGAAEGDMKGVSLVRVVSDVLGDRFEVTVTPPADRAVDPRFMDDFQIAPSAQMEAGHSFAKAAQEDDADAAVEPVDVSGYHVTVVPLSLAGCSLQFTIDRSKPANLNKGTYYYVEVKGAAAMVVTAFPTSGDVNAEIRVNGASVCSTSKKGKGTLDVATCVSSVCNTEQDTLRGMIVNSTNSTAKFVGTIAVFVSN